MPDQPNTTADTAFLSNVHPAIWCFPPSTHSLAQQKLCTPQSLDLLNRAFLEHQMLGKDLVIWRNGDGTWATFEDRCPHRAAPLTEGRVEKDGTLS